MSVTRGNVRATKGKFKGNSRCYVFVKVELCRVNTFVRRKEILRRPMDILSCTTDILRHAMEIVSHTK